MLAAAITVISNGVLVARLWSMHWIPVPDPRYVPGRHRQIV